MDEDRKATIHRGLNGVYFDRSRVCDIDGKAGELRYRGYSIHDLAERSTFEETCFLLFHGELPREVLDLIALVKGAHPMDVLRTAVSALAASDPDVADNSPEAILRKGV